ncbi:MAG: response regulator, partial [Polyangiaceae bacterium]
MLSSLPSARPALLVVDDEEAIREMLAEFLSLEGYDVETAEHGIAALGVLETRLFDIVLTDLKMPKMG